MAKPSVATIGFGWVGKSMQQLFPDIYVYDPAQGYGEKEEVNKREIAFVCVPTPVISEGELDTSVVEDVVAWCECPIICIRSTVNPGTCDRLAKKYGKRIVMQPEYLGETQHHPFLDPTNRPFIVIGGAPEDRKKVLDAYFTTYNANTAVRLVSCLEAEVIKLSENRAIAFKVCQVEELIDVCRLAGVDYYVIRDAVYADDPRFNLWWTADFVGNRGLKSKCLPKDAYAWCAWAESLGYNPVITRTLLEKNKEWVTSNEDIR